MHKRLAHLTERGGERERNIYTHTHTHTYIYMGRYVYLYIYYIIHNILTTCLHSIHSLINLYLNINICA